MRDLNIRRWISLAVAVAAIGGIWLVLLPLIGGQKDVAAHIANQQQLGINPSALYYTELEVAPVLTDHVERVRDTHPDKFWK